MIIEGIHVEKFNNKIFVHGNTFVYKGERIYYFTNLKENIFCTKENNKYIPITDKEKICFIRNIFGFVSPLGKNNFASSNSIVKRLSKSLRPVTENMKILFSKKRRLSFSEEEKIKQEQKSNYRLIKDKLGLNINLEQMDRQLDSVRFFEMPNNARFSGLYRWLNNSVKYTTSVLTDWDDVYSRKTRLHEVIHAQTGANSILYSVAGIEGLLEGETDSLATETLIGKNSCERMIRHKGIDRRAVFNFPPETAYQECVCLVRQMEVAIGKKSYESILKGDLSFEKEFKKRYGLIALIAIADKANSLMLSSLGNIQIDKFKTLEQTQNKLLKIVFNRDQKDIHSIEDAQKYFEKLRLFETVRAKTYVRRNFLENEEKDTTYERFYQQKFAEVQKILERQGYSKEEIEHGLSSFEYQEQAFYPFKDPIQEAKKEFAEIIALDSKEGKEDLKEYKLYRVSDPEGRIHYCTVKNKKRLSVETEKSPEGKEYKKLQQSRSDIESLIDFVQERGGTITEVTQSLDPKEIMDLIKTVREENAQTDTALVPKEKQSIFQTIFNKVKSLFQGKKPEVTPTMAAANIVKPDKPTELPKWDLRNYSKEDQERAKKLNGPLDLLPNNSINNIQNEKNKSEER